MSNAFIELSNAMTAAVEKAGASTVTVHARRRMPATGIAIAADQVLTANHVVELNEGIIVTLPDGTEVAATLAGRDPASDLALLRLAEPKAQPAEAAGEARVGQFVLALGRPSENGIEASLGVVSAISGPVRTHHGGLDGYLRTDTTPFPGFSGGPLVDAEGRVVGLNTSGFGHGEAITIPAEVALKIADQLAKHGSRQRGYLGVRSQAVEIASAAQEALKREQATGLLVMGVEKDSPAESANLMVGDILVAIAGQSIRNHDELFAALVGDVVGQPTAVEILRGGQPQTISVTIGARA